MRICTVGDCTNKHYAKGMCHKHYMRVRTNGTVKLKRTPNGESLRHFFEEVLSHEGKKACLIWPYQRNAKGYGTVWYKGKNRLVHRLACRAVNGKPPTPLHQACHSCGNGNEGCVNQHHVYWGTPKQNSGDSILHGTQACGERQGSSKLTDKKVRSILKFVAAGKSLKAIADKFGVSYLTIYYIKNNATWKHIERRV